MLYKEVSDFLLYYYFWVVLKIFWWCKNRELEGKNILEWFVLFLGVMKV